MIKKNGYNFDFDEEACKFCKGSCCRGSEGYIFLTLSEMKAISSSLNLCLDEFIKKYTVKIGRKFSLIEYKYNAEYICCFFDIIDSKCKIYENRPEQCKTFPFWSCFMGVKKDDYEIDLLRCPGCIFNDT